MLFQKSNLLGFIIASTVIASATTPVVTVASPASGASVGSPVNYVASASTTCAGGIASMRIYTAPHVNAFNIQANKLNTNINLKVGSYSTVVQAWDKCGGVGKKTINVKVSKINLPAPRFLYATEFKAGRIAEYVVNPLNGSLSPTSQSSMWTHWGPVDIAANGSATHLYVTNQGSQDMSAYLINRTSGNLTQASGSPYKLAGVGHRVVVHPSGNFVYASSTVSKNGIVQSTSIDAFAVQSDGSLKPVPGSPFAIASSQLLPALAMDSKGEYLYASQTTSGGGAIQGFSINEVNGALTPIPGSPFMVPVGSCDPSADACHETPTDFAVHPNGNYLYAVLGIESALAGFAIDRSTGSLTNLPGSPYPEQSPFGNFCPNNAFGTCPYSWTASMDPSGKFIYVADSDFSEFSIFKPNPNTGVLTFAGTTQNSQSGICDPFTVNVDPSGSFLYTQGFTGNKCAANVRAILGFSFNQSNGQLNPVPGSPFANPNVGTGNTSEEKVLVTR